VKQAASALQRFRNQFETLLLCISGRTFSRRDKIVHGFPAAVLGSREITRILPCAFCGSKGTRSFAGFFSLFPDEGDQRHGKYASYDDDRFVKRRDQERHHNGFYDRYQTNVFRRRRHQFLEITLDAG